MTAEKTCKNKLDAFSQSDDDAVVVLCMTGMKSYLSRSINMFFHWGKHQHQLCIMSEKANGLTIPFMVDSAHV